MQKEDNGSQPSSAPSTPPSTPTRHLIENGKSILGTPTSGGITPMPGSAESGTTIISADGRSRSASVDMSKLKFEDDDDGSIGESKNNQGGDLDKVGDTQGLLDRMASSVPKSKEDLVQKLSQPEAKFAGGMFVGKAFVAPTLNYLGDQISGDNKGKTTISYFQDSLAKLPLLVIKAGLFYAVLSVPYKVDPVIKAPIAKVTSDFIYNAGMAVVTKQVDSLQKMASFDYVKELAVWYVPGATSKVLGMTAAKAYLPDVNELYQKYPEFAGGLLGASSEIMDFAQTCYDKVHDMYA